jgi:hypothetical protein
VPEATATIPVKDAAFARHLEHTAFMPCMHPDVVAAAKRAVGKETDARRAAARLSRFVFSTLEKKSSEINETTALEILQSGSGDCSEHALLFVTLCRSVGIPARRCSGYCCIGTIWGAHAWAEVWTGEWIGVDPTTDDVGTAARYVFFGYQDDPDSTNGVVSMRVRGRMKIRTTAVVEGDERVDLRDTANHRVVDLERRTASHRLAGIEMRDIPKEWKVVLRGAGDATIRGEGFSAKIRVMADQGSRDVTPSDEDGRKSTFAGAPALRMDHGGRTTFLVASRRRHVWIDVEHPGLQRKEIVPALERVLAKTFSMRPGK